MMRNIWRRLMSWEGLLLVILVAVVAFNVLKTPHYLEVENLINLFKLRIELIIVALVMAFIIINAEIDLSVASVMGLSGAVMAWCWSKGLPFPEGLAAGMLTGLAIGTFNGFMVAFVGLPSLIVTLAGLIGWRGMAHVLMQNQSVGNFPAWFNHLGQDPLVGPLPFSLVAFFVLLVIALVILQWSAFGRYVYVIGNSRDVARYSGVNVRRVKMTLFIASGVISAFAGLLIAARLTSMRGDTAQGGELEVITMVLLGGVSIFGGSGSLFGVLLSILIVLNVHNGMGLLNMTAEAQTGAVGLLLILSVLLPNMARGFQEWWGRRQRGRLALAAEGRKEVSHS